MKTYKCIGCSARCGATASDRPTECLFEKDSKSPWWELVEQETRNNYATVKLLDGYPFPEYKKCFYTSGKNPPICGSSQALDFNTACPFYYDVEKCPKYKEVRGE